MLISKLVSLTCFEFSLCYHFVLSFCIVNILSLAFPSTSFLKSYATNKCNKWRVT